MYHQKFTLCLLFFAAFCSNSFAEQPKSSTVTVKGVKIHYVEQGQGQPIILIHGLHASAVMNWQLPGIFNQLAANNRVIALDLPGHGKSDKPDSEEAYGLQMVEDIVTLMDHLQIKKAHVVGYSLGGMITLKFIAKHPDRVLSAVLGGMGWLQDGGPLQKVWDRMGNRKASTTPQQMVNSIGKLAVSEQEIKEIKVPVCVIVGDRDPLKNLYVTPLKKARADWPVTEIFDAGHLDCIAKKSFRDEISNWIKKQSK